MYNSSARKEIIPIDGNEYSEFGKPYTNFPQEFSQDAADCCLPGNFLNCPQVSQLGLCPSYMAQRCSNNWDDKCTTYINSIDDNQKLKDFVRDLASKKYCQLAPTSTCTKMCQPFDPISQSSPQVCQYVGRETLKDSNANIDIGYYFPVNISPDYMSNSCIQTCNVVHPSEIKSDDVAINACLKYGFCNDILTNICALSEKSQYTISHPGLNNFCKTKTKVPIPTSNNIKEKMGNIRKERLTHENGVGRWSGLIIFIIVIILLFAYQYFKKRKRSK